MATEFSDPPETAELIGEPKRAGRYKVFAADLRRNVGRWAKVPATPESEMGAQNTARRIWRGDLLDFAVGRYEVALDGLGIWARCVDATAKPRKEGPAVVVMPVPNGLPENKEVREWAKQNGYRVPSRGRLPGALMNAYLNAHDDTTATG